MRTMFAFLLCCSLVSSHPAFAQPTPASAPAQTAAPASLPAAGAKAFVVETIGKGRPMILIPGLLSSGEVWRTTVDRYKDRYECHVLTLAGFAGQPPIAAPFLDTVRAALIDYIKARRLSRPILVGHSLGGFLAFWVAATAPDAVGGVIAVDGVPFLPALMQSGATIESARPQAEQLRQLYATFTPAQLRAQSKMSMAGQMKRPADVERALAWVEASSATATGEAVYEMMVTDLRDRVGAITAPVLLLGAADFAKDDPAMRARAQMTYEAQVAKVSTRTVTLVPEARHFIMFDAPEALWSAMDGFLTSPAVSGTPAKASGEAGKR